MTRRTTHGAGRAVSARAGSWNTKGLVAAHQWLRDAAPIARDTGATYRLVEGDVGKRISVPVTATKQGRAPGTAVSAARLVPVRVARR